MQIDVFIKFTGQKEVAEDSAVSEDCNGLKKQPEVCTMSYTGLEMLMADTSSAVH